MFFHFPIISTLDYRTIFTRKGRLNTVEVFSLVVPFKIQLTNLILVLMQTLSLTYSLSKMRNNQLIEISRVWQLYIWFLLQAVRSSKVTVPATHMHLFFLSHKTPLISWLEDRVVTDHAWKRTVSSKNLHVYWTSVFLSWKHFCLPKICCSTVYRLSVHTEYPSVCQSLLTVLIIAWRNKYKYTRVYSAYWPCYINLVSSLSSLQNLQNKCWIKLSCIPCGCTVTAALRFSLPFYQKWFERALPQVTL